MGKTDPPVRRGRVPAAAAFVVLAASTVAGAVVGAALEPAPENRHVAEAAVVAGDGSRAEVGRLAELIPLPYVQTLARAQLGEPTDFTPDVSIEPRPELGMVAIRVATTSPELARVFADAVATQSIAFDDALEGSEGSAIPLGDFEDGYGAWLVGPRALGASTGNVQISVEDPRFNGASVEVDCTDTEACGFARNVSYPFRSGGRYRVVGWVRGIPGEAVSVEIGVPGDSFTSDPVPLDSRWRQVVVDWVPAADRQIAELRWQAASSSTKFALDGVWMADGAALRNAGVTLPSGESEAAIFQGQGGPRTLPAVAAETVDASTLRAAVIGALLGFLCGLVALALVSLHRRR